MNINYLLNYFRNTLPAPSLSERVGMEVETSFVDATAKPVTVKVSQGILRNLKSFQVTQTKGGLITELYAQDGSKILYELGRQNLELSLAPYPVNAVVKNGREYLDELYAAAESVGAYPYFSPILKTDEDLLMIPDERDATWLKLDGRPALNLLANCSSVQFTVETSFEQATIQLNKLLDNLPAFLADYPQDKLWRQYIAESEADYRVDRYGGPSQFASMEHYCEELILHDVVLKGALIPQSAIGEYNINLFLRSVWWYFRLRRYVDTLCIEVRPLPRLTDSQLGGQLQKVLNTLS